MAEFDPNFNASPRVIIWLIGCALITVLVILYLMGCASSSPTPAPLPVPPTPPEALNFKALAVTTNAVFAPSLTNIYVTGNNGLLWPNEYTVLKWSSDLSVPRSNWVQCWIAPASNFFQAVLPVTNTQAFITALNIITNLGTNQ